MFDYVLRLILAVVVGAIIGFEREKRKKAITIHHKS